MGLPRKELDSYTNTAQPLQPQKENGNFPMQYRPQPASGMSLPAAAEAKGTRFSSGFKFFFFPRDGSLVTLWKGYIHLKNAEIQDFAEDYLS